VVLDLVQPHLARRRALGFGREARGDEATREDTRTRQHGALIGQAHAHGKAPGG